jgi:hypothetical protein
MRATTPTQMHHAWKVASVYCSWRKYPFKAKMLSSHMSCQWNHRSVGVLLQNVSCNILRDSTYHYAFSKN